MAVFDIPFAQFTPDGGRLENPGLLNADNVAPFGMTGFTPIATINVTAPEVAGFASKTLAAVDDPTSMYAVGGAAVFIPATGTGYRVYSGTMSGVPGSEDRTYINCVTFDEDGTVTSADTDSSENDSVVQREGWFFAVYGNSVVAVGGHDITPKIAIDASVDGSEVPSEDLWTGSVFFPYPKYVAVIGLRMLLANVKESDIVYPNRVWWSATDNIRYYSDTQTDPSTRSGYQDLHDEYGPITGLVGGTDYAYVAKADCWYRMDFGGPFDFQFRPFAIGHGCLFPHSIVKFGDSIYFWGPYGPAVIRGTADPEPLGLGVFNRTLKDGSWVQEYGSGPVAACPPHRMIGFVDAENELIGWAYNSQNALAEDVDWLWVIDTVFLYNVRYGRGSLIRNLMQTDVFNESGDETGIDFEGVPDDILTRIDPDGIYPPDWRPSWPIFVPRQPNLDGFAQWAPILRVHWWMTTKGFESMPVATWRNTIGVGLAYGDNTASPLARFRTGYIVVDPDTGGDGRISRVRLHFSTNVGGVAPEYEIRLLTAKNPTEQPSDPVIGSKPNDRGWVPFPQSPNAPYCQFDVRIKNPYQVGEIEKLEVDVGPAGTRK